MGGCSCKGEEGGLENLAEFDLDAEEEEQGIGQGPAAQAIEKPALRQNKELLGKNIKS